MRERHQKDGNTRETLKKQKSCLVQINSQREMNGRVYKHFESEINAAVLKASAFVVAQTFSP